MFAAIIREWDGTLARVRTDRKFYDANTFSVVDLVAMTYSDGVTHEVSPEYFASIFVCEVFPNDIPRPNYTPVYWDVV